MNLILLLLVSQVVWAEKWDFYHERSVKAFHPPKVLRKDSYFGFSTTYDRYNKRLMISAPREDNIGQVYECDLTEITNKSCSILARSFSREANAPLYENDFWFGATIKAGATFVVACTPRYTLLVTGYTDAGTYGRCYSRQKNDPNFDAPKFPQLVTGAPEYKNQELKMDTLGWSLDVGEDNSMIVGGLGLQNKTGTAAILGVGQKLLKRISHIEHNLFNYGYSVAIGYFTKPNNLSYAVSTTYGTNGTGQVYFYNKVTDYGIILNKGKDYDAIGSMFGAVLCAAKMNPLSKGDDLLVGAPTYAQNSEYNTGAVYVYSHNNEKKGRSPIYNTIIVGQKSESMFGSAIISVGDLNGDGRDEIAIGAPFEDDGAVYLYSGAALFSDKTLKWLQKIKPSGKNLRSFGYSLAALRDYDDNGCNELAVSAPYEDTVMLYKCMAAVTITKIHADFPDVKNRTVSRQTDFVFKVCIDVQYPKKPINIIGDLSTDVTMEHQYARFKNPSHNNIYEYTFETKLQSKNETYCENVDFILPLDKDYSLEIKYTIQTKLQNSPLEMETVSGAHVILSDNSKLSYSNSFWAAECAGVDECISNLSLTITSDLTDTPFITGSRDMAKFHISVLNTGEVAYDPCIQFDINGAILQKPAMHCNNDMNLEETWKCISMTPIKTNMTWEIKDTIVDLQGLTNKDEEISLNVKLFVRCNDTNHSKSYRHRIPLKSSSDGVSINGYTNTGVINIMEKDISVPKHFEQIYTIINNGPTNFKDLTSTITLQKSEFITYSDEPVSIHIDATTKSKETHGVCRDTNNDIEMTATCLIDSLNKDNYVRVMISLYTNPNVLTYNKLKKQDNIEVTSNFTINFDKETPKHFSLTTQIKLREASVALWIWIVAGLVGLLLIIILACVLYKYGFLQRQNKKKLEGLKADIKRQTIRQSMTRPKTGDTNQILENMEEADETVPSDPHPGQNECARPAPNETTQK